MANRRPPPIAAALRAAALRAAALLLCGLLTAGCGLSPVELAPAEAPATREGRISLYRKTVQAFLDADRLPIIDMDVMLSPGADTSALVLAMDRAGVALAAVTSPRPETIQRAVKKHPSRLVPLTSSPDGDSWASPDRAILRSTRRQLGAGDFGIGRIRMDLGPGLNLSGKKRRAREAAIKKQKAAFEAILRLSAEIGAAVWLEMEPEDDGLGWLERQLRAYPGSAAVWNRTGYLPSPEKLPAYGQGLLRAVTLRRPNLYLILTQRPPGEPNIFPAPRPNLLFDPGGRFSQEWRAVLESRIAHFISGSSLEALEPAQYVRRHQNYSDGVLDNLTPPARRRLAYRNAWKLLTGSDWDG